MFYVDTITQATYEVKKSTFTSYILPYEEFDTYHDRLKKSHPKANHIIWAFRYLNTQGQIVEGGSDDGEPKGVAATPTLNILRGENLINCAILTIRYFGGIKLGTGGMVRAYRKSAKEVLESAKLTPYIEKKVITFSTPYTLVNRYEHYFNKHHISYHDREFMQDRVIWRVSLSKEEKERLKNFIISL